jgi:hypothetical protein
VSGPGVASALSAVSSLIAGSAFLFAGTLKVLSPSAFVRHLSNLNTRAGGALPTSVLVWTGSAVAAVESALGLCLALRLFPGETFPLSLTMLLLFTAITVWGASTGRISDCGCYGNLVVLSPLASVSLTVLYAGLIVFAWWQPASFALARAVQWNISIGSFAFFAGASGFSSWSFAKFWSDLVDTGPLQPGKRWNPAWLAGFGVHASGREMLVVLMSRDCSVCEKWIQPLNKISRRANMPQVIAGMVGDEEEIGGFKRDSGVAFPVLAVKRETMGRLALAYPTIVGVADGVIGSVDVGRLAPALAERLRS